MNKLILMLIIILELLSLQVFSQSDSIINGEVLTRLMHKKYSDVWYKHLSFKQDMFRYKDDSLLQNEVWIVAYTSPGKLHIRYKDFDTGRGWLVVNDSLYTFNHNKLIGKKPRLHELLTLGFDIYIVSPSLTIQKLKQMGFDLSVLTVTTKNGNDVYEVGNYDSLCYWVHIESLLFYGYRKNGEAGESEVFFDNYKDYYGKPVATQIHYFQNGKLYLLENYYDIRLPSDMPNSFFEPDHFSQTRW